MNRLPTAAGGPPIWDHCVICGDPAYRYPPGLHIFPRMQDRDAEFSYNFLYEIFCDNLGITEHSQLRLLWNFRELSFPFCNDCETLLSDVASRSIEIGEQAFEPAIFKRMIINEYKFIDQNIYRQHNSRYLRLRDAVLGSELILLSFRFRSQIIFL